MRVHCSVLLGLVILVGSASCGDSDDDGPYDLYPGGGDSQDGGDPQDGGDAVQVGAPTITSFTATPASLDFRGGPVTLAWNVGDAETLAITPDVGAVTGTSVVANVTTTTTFTLTATNAAGSTTATTTVTLEARPRGTVLYALTESAHLIALDENTPDLVDADVAISGVAAGETLVAIDVRPMNGRLYGLATIGTTARLYHIDMRTGEAVALGAPFSFQDALGNQVAITGDDFDLDFNPTVDRLRVVTSSGMSFRINPNSGAPVDGDNGSAVAVLNTNPDGATGATLGGAAYTNNTINVATTTLYTLSADGTTLAIQNPPNVGTQTAQTAITVEGAAIAAGTRVGFDIPKGVQTAAANAAVTSGSGYIAVVRASGTALYRLDLASAAATTLGTIEVNVRDIAVWTPTQVGVALSGSSIMRFDLATPGTVTTVALGALGGSEVATGITLRPANGQFLLLGVDSAASTATLYRLDPQTGAVTPVSVSASNAVAFVDALGAAVPLDASLRIGFNNTADRVRVLGTTGLNFRINPETGGPVDGSTTINGANTDASLNGSATSSSAVAYLDVAPAADLMVSLDGGQDVLSSSTAPNSGALSLVGDLGIDCDGSSAALADGGEGILHGALTVVGGATGLYRLDTVTGEATSLGAISSGAFPVIGLVTVVPSATMPRLVRP